MTKEEFYDAEIAPVLADLLKRCQGRGLDMVALVGYDDDGSVASSVALSERAPTILRFARALSQSWAPGGAVNIDSFMFEVMRVARKTGHNSVVLKQLGVSPVAEA